jgi:hypothetical protein
LEHDTVRVARAYLKSAASGAMLPQSAALVGIALLGVDEAVSRHYIFAAGPRE